MRATNTNIQIYEWFSTAVRIYVGVRNLATDFRGMMDSVGSISNLITWRNYGRRLMALLERELDYRRITFVELGSQLSYYTVGIARAHSGWGVWSLVGGMR